MKSTLRSSGKGKLKLVIITFINKHFLVKKRLLPVEKLLFLFDAHKTSFILAHFMHCCSVPPNYGRKDHLISLLVKSWNRSKM